MQEILSELCVSWPDRWDEYVAPACWIKRTLPDPSLPTNMTPFEILFGRSPRTSLDTLVPQVEDTDLTGGLDNFVEARRQNLRDVAIILEKRHADKMAARSRVNKEICRPSAGVGVEIGDFVLVREMESTIYREGVSRKIQHERWTGPWTVEEIGQIGLILKVVMQGRKVRARTVSTADVKLFHVRPPDLRHPMADEFAQFAWTSDLGLKSPSTVANPFYTLVDRRRVTSSKGVERWEYRGCYQRGTDSRWVSEVEALDSFTPLQLDVFHAQWNLYQPLPDAATPPPSKKRCFALPRSTALELFPIGTPTYRSSGSTEMLGQGYDYHTPYWRIRYPDNNWEELSRREMEQPATELLAKKQIST